MYTMYIKGVKKLEKPFYWHFCYTCAYMFIANYMPDKGPRELTKNALYLVHFYWNVYHHWLSG